MKYVHDDHYDKCIIPSANSKDSSHVCCCKADLPHDESIKLMLLFNDNKTEYGQETIFSDLRPGTYQLINSNFYQSVNFKSVSVIGQNKLLYSMIKHFFIEGARVLYICGPPGSGKSTVCKAFSNYVQERHKFSKFVLEKLSNSHNTQLLISRAIGYVNLRDIPESIKNEERLVIFENADSLIKDHSDEFDEQINALVEATKTRLIIEVTSKSLLDRRKKPRKYECMLNVPGLKDLDAAKFVKNHITNIHASLNAKDKDIYNLKENPVFKQDLTPKELLDLVKRINKEKKDFKDICQDFLKERQERLVGEEASAQSAAKDESEEDREIIECLQ